MRLEARQIKIALALALSLLGLALLPVLALPYGILDWVVYDPAYKQGTSVPPTPTPVTAVPEIPCAELPAPGDPLAARVNGQGIGLQAFERELSQFLRAWESLGKSLEGEEKQDATSLARSRMPALRRQVLNLLIDDALVQQAAVEVGITVSDEEIQTRLAEEIFQGGGPEVFQAWLEETGQTWSEFERDLCQDLLRQAVLDQVTANITGTMELVRAQQIVVATERDAVSVLARLASREPFADVAREVSLDEQTRGRGGDLGWFPRGRGWVSPEVEGAAFASTPGQVRGPIQVGERYVIVQTVERRADYPLDPDSRDTIRAFAFERWLAARRGAAEIEIYINLDP